jgi:hypothetical protein
MVMLGCAFRQVNATRRMHSRRGSECKAMLNPLLSCYHTTGDAVTGVSGGIGFHVVGLCMIAC